MENSVLLCICSSFDNSRELLSEKSCKTRRESEANPMVVLPVGRKGSSHLIS